MLNKLFFSLLLFAAVFTPSFTTIQAVVDGNSLTITHSDSGTAVMHWTFSQPAVSYFIIIDDMTGKQSIKAVSTTNNTYTITGLTAGHYRYKVTNGTEFIIGDDINP